MTIEQFKNNWQPQMDSYARYNFNLDLKELEQQIRKEAEQEHAKMCESCIHKVSKEDIDAIRADVIDECIDTLYEVTPQTIDEKLDMVFVNALKELKEQK